MILVFIFLAIIISILIIIFLLILSNIVFEIKDLKIYNFNLEKNKKEKKAEYEIILRLKLFNKITLFKIKTNEAKIKKVYKKYSINKDMLKNTEKYLIKNIKISSLIKKINIKVDKLYLKCNIGTQDAMFTAFIVATVASIIAVVLPHVVYSMKNLENYKYSINPVFIDRNIYKVELNCIINIKMVKIIYIIFNLLKARRKSKNERASNRRTYGYSYE